MIMMIVYLILAVEDVEVFLVGGQYETPDLGHYLRSHQEYLSLLCSQTSSGEGLFCMVVQPVDDGCLLLALP